MVPMVAFRTSEPLGSAPVVPLSLLNFANKGVVMPFATFALPKEGLHAQWFTAQAPYTGWLAHAFIHTHTRIFSDVWVYAADARDLNLDRGGMMQRGYSGAPLLKLQSRRELEQVLEAARDARLVCRIDRNSVRFSADPRSGANLQADKHTHRRLLDRATPLTCDRSWVFAEGDPITVVGLFEAGLGFRKTAEGAVGSQDALYTPELFKRSDIFLQHLGLRMFGVRQDARQLGLREAGRAVCPVTWATYVPEAEGAAVTPLRWVTCG